MVVMGSNTRISLPRLWTFACEDMLMKVVVPAGRVLGMHVTTNYTDSRAISVRVTWTMLSKNVYGGNN